jgi:hypothetical protein
MPGSWTSPDRPGARANAPVRVAFRGGKRVGVRDYRTFAAQWLACTIPCRRFAGTLTGTDARLGADVDVAVGAGVTSRPPRRSRRAAFPHRAPVGSQAWSMFGAWAAHTVSTRGPMPRGHAWSGSVSGACVGIVLSSRPGPFPPHPPPPLLAALFGVSSVLWTRPTPPTFRSGFGSSPSRTGPGPPWRLRAAGGLPGSDAIPSSVMWPQTPAGRRCLA